MARIQLLHDTAANWTSADSVLRAGELGIEEDTGQFKIGDGSTAWTSLPYAGGGAAALDDLTDVNAPSPTDQYVLTWDDMAGEWVPATPAGGAPTGAAGGVLSGTYPNPGFAADMATQAELDAHTGDTSDAHDASAVSFAPAGTIAATDVQAAIAELDGDSRMSDSRAPSGSAGGDLSGTYPNPSVTDDSHAHSASTLTGIATLGATEPGAVSTTSSGTAGSGATASKVDHSHDLGFDDATADPSAIGAVADGTATSAARKDHVHATGAGTPSTQAFGDVAATGTGPAAAMTDHVHGMPDNPAGANSGGGDIDIASVTDITIASITTTIVAGNVFLFEIWGTIFNNSTASRIYTFTLDVNGFLVSIATSAGLTNSATARSPFSYSGHVEVRATNLVYGDAILGYRNSIAAATATAETARLWVWNTGTSDRTGVGKVVAIKVKSANATATQNLLYFARITKV